MDRRACFMASRVRDCPKADVARASAAFAGCGLALLILAGCEDARSRYTGAAASGRVDRESCSSGADDWRPTKDARVEAVGEGLDLSPSLGLAAHNDLVLSFDGALAHIGVSNREDALVRRIGRDGDGPGEFRPPRSAGGTVLPQEATADWLAVQGDTLVAFDGRRLQVITVAGDHVTDVSEFASLATGAGPLFSSRIRTFGDTILLDLERQGGQRRRGVVDGRSFTLWRMVRGGSAQPIWSMPLQLLPTTDRGTTYRGTREARPLWDARNGCFVISDGGQPFLFVGSIARAGFDTVRVRLPDREPRSHDEAALIALRAGAGQRPPEPTLAKRIRRLVLSPDGWVWLEPVQPASLADVEVIRVNIASGQQRTDTLPFFPAVFGRRGEVLSIARTGAGAYSIRRVLMSNLRPE